MEKIHVALTIAGSDNSAGAGLQADLKTFGALGVYGLTAATCVVAEVPGKVSAIQAIEPRIVAEQIRLCLESFPVGAIKTGLLHSRQTVEAVCDTLADFFGKKTRGALVVDPVIVATSGDALLKKGALTAYKKFLFPRAALVTPNLDEAGVLLGRKISTLEKMREAARELAEEFGAPFLVKGGHLRGRDAIDVLFAGGGLYEFSAPRVPRVATHGTGCTYSAAIAAHLARGFSLDGAIANAKRFVTAAIKQHFQWKTRGDSVAALNHFAQKNRPPR